MASIRDVGYKTVFVDGTKRAAFISETAPFTKANTISTREAQTLANAGISYEQRRGEALPTKEYKLRELTSQGQAIVRDYLKTQREQGKSITEREARASKEFKDIQRALKYEGKTDKSRAPTSAKAKALVKLGRRRPEDDWNVGETPDEGEEAA